MDWIFRVLGFATLCLLVIGGTLYVVALGVKQATTIDAGTRQVAHDAAIMEVGTDLIKVSHWFDESPESQLAVELLGRQLIDKGQFNISEVRAEWVKRLPPKPKPTPIGVRVGGAGNAP